MWDGRYRFGLGCRMLRSPPVGAGRAADATLRPDRGSGKVSVRPRCGGRSAHVPGARVPRASRGVGRRFFEGRPAGPARHGVVLRERRRAETGGEDPRDAVLRAVHADAAVVRVGDAPARRERARAGGRECGVTAKGPAEAVGFSAGDAWAASRAGRCGAGAGEGAGAGAGCACSRISRGCTRKGSGAGAVAAIHAPCANRLSASASAQPGRRERPVRRGAESVGTRVACMGATP